MKYNYNLKHTRKDDHPVADFVAHLMVYGASAYISLLLVIAVGSALHVI